MHTMLGRCTNDNVRVFDYYVLYILVGRIGLSSNIVVVAFSTHRIVTTDCPTVFKYESINCLRKSFSALFFICIFDTTVEPLTNDHLHQRPSLSYDHISCDGQWVLFVYESLTSDHPSYTTTPTGNVILRVVV